jgi:hypothetical protein
MCQFLGRLRLYYLRSWGNGVLVEMSGLKNRLAAIETRFDLILPTIDPVDNIYGSGIPASEFKTELSNLVDLCDAVDKRDVAPILWNKVVFEANARADVIESILNSPMQTGQGLLGMTPALAINIKALESSLKELLSTTPLPEAQMKEVNRQAIWVGKKFSEVERLMADSETDREEVRRIVGELADKQSEIIALAAAVENQKELINSAEKEIIQSKQLAEANSLSALQSAAAVQDLLKVLLEAKSKQDEIFEKFEAKESQVADILTSANQKGLAGSFKSRGLELNRRLILWGVVFAVSIVGLSLFSIHAVGPLFKGSHTFAEVVGRIVLISPLVWLATFSSHQYVYTMRIREDYAFKEAAAMAYVGYRDEMAIDPKMLELLQKVAVVNFGLNPVTHLFRNVEATSPYGQVTDFIKNLNFLK